MPGSFGNIDQRILGRSIAAEIALHSREAGEVTRENAAIKKPAAQFSALNRANETSLSQLALSGKSTFPKLLQLETWFGDLALLEKNYYREVACG